MADRISKVSDKKDRKTIKFTYEGIDYTLEFTPYSIRKMEKDGFDFTNMDKQVINLGYDLFRGAFISRHNYVPVEKRDEIYNALSAEDENGNNLIAILADMMKDEIDYIVSKPSGNVRWVMG